MFAVVHVNQCENLVQLQRCRCRQLSNVSRGHRIASAWHGICKQKDSLCFGIITATGDVSPHSGSVGVDVAIGSV